MEKRHNRHAENSLPNSTQPHIGTGRPENPSLHKLTRSIQAGLPSAHWSRSGTDLWPQECALLGSQVSGGSGVQRGAGGEEPEALLCALRSLKVHPQRDLADTLSAAASFLTSRGDLGSLLRQEQ